MLNNQRICVVLPAYNAAETLEKTYREIPFDIVDDVVLVDDASKDQTSELAKRLGIQHVIRHEQNRGYGGNQKSCYAKALQLKADIVIMLHPDYQYTPKLIHSMASVIAFDVYPVVMGSRILGKGALKGGMPMYKYIANRFLTLGQNIVMGQKLSEYHSGYRAFSSKVFDAIQIEKNSDDFIFDNENIYKKEDTSDEELLNFIDSLSQTQFEKVAKFFETMPKLKHKISWKCGGCGEEDSVELEGMSNFFVF